MERPRGELDATLADPRELSGVLNRALPALQRVRARGRFTETKSTANALAEFQQLTDPLAVSLDRETVAHPNALVQCGTLLFAYNDDCVRHGRPVMNQTAFGSLLRDLRKGVEVKKRGPKGALKECYIGIGLGADPEYSQGGSA